MTSPHTHQAPRDIREDVPSVARMYDFYLGGHHNFAVDRAAAQMAISLFPELPLIMQANRAYLRRTVSFLVGQGIEQFLDIGSGIPTAQNVHEVAQRANPDARVVYVDIDPVAVAHSAAILEGNPRVASIQADVRDAEALLAHPNVRAQIEDGRPIALLLVALLHFLTDEGEAYAAVQRLRDALPSGSYMVISHATAENVPSDVRDQMIQVYTRTSSNLIPRTHPQVERFFDGLTLVEPGLVYLPEWHPEGPDDVFFDRPERSISYGAVGRKP